MHGDESPTSCASLNLRPRPRCTPWKVGVRVGVGIGLTLTLNRTLTPTLTPDTGVVTDPKVVFDAMKGVRYIAAIPLVGNTRSRGLRPIELPSVGYGESALGAVAP